MGSLIQIGVSSCLLGNKVRYDGEHSRSDDIVDSLSEIFELMPFCPEVAIGLGIPRPPIQLVSIHNDIRVRGVSDTSHDVTEALTNVASNIEQQLDLLNGYIFKSRSPSCGLTDVNVYDVKTNLSIGMTSGQFAKIIMQRYPTLPVADENMMADKKLRTDFINSVKNYHKKRIPA